MTQQIDRDTVQGLCRRAALRSGASERVAELLAHATLEAETRGRQMVGLTHFFDYLDGLEQGRIDGLAVPHVHQPSPGVVIADCRSGIAHLGFEDAYDSLVRAARVHGIAMLSLRNAFTVGELGYYARRVCEADLAVVAGATSPALMSIGGAMGPVLGTNPLAFGVARPDARALVVDQASSQTAFVSIRSAADRGELIPDGWALDQAGIATTDPTAALGGALLPFGGYKGGNIALMVELLAVLSGAGWSSDAPRFDSGTESPGAAMFVIAINSATFDPGYGGRVGGFVEQLEKRWSIDVSKFEDPVPATTCALDPRLVQRLEEAAGLR